MKESKQILKEAIEQVSKMIHCFEADIPVDEHRGRVLSMLINAKVSYLQMFTSIEHREYESALGRTTPPGTRQMN